ncbi:Gamma-interferon-inducible-lysosomal thiol reductase [Portunus trituberculatus]|uniref:Gamma-interferon-inducible-lysosomal thiol reductase n=1 Tax=Portunus trituberculatus TaxID=210409 RepID=A0A5B7CLR8_PORTR|nr:Gamma-interferon-inducible-lysosomal thiol reductase [Portunus trituberculatus]
MMVVMGVVVVVVVVVVVMMVEPGKSDARQGMNYFNPFAACANETGVDYSDVEECMRSDVGVKLQHNIGERQAQLDPRLSYVPWILIDDEFTEKTLTEAQDDLMRVVCDAYKGPTPEACQE